jgi:putative ABC transport system ATP-binding protein
MATCAGLPLRIRNLIVAFDDGTGLRRTVLDIPAFDLDGTRQLALCGASGSGKTTLLHLLAGIEAPVRGSIRWGEIDVTALTGRPLDRWRRLTVGLVFQQFHLFPRLSAFENVVLPARFDHCRLPAETVSRARDLLRQVGVDVVRPVYTLSRGEMQRVAVARALVHRPAIVLADEPTASLDAETAQETLALLASLCRDHRATLIVATHDEGLAKTLDRRADISRQRLVEGSAAPASASVAR